MQWGESCILLYSTPIEIGLNFCLDKLFLTGENWRTYFRIDREWNKLSPWRELYITDYVLWWYVDDQTISIYCVLLILPLNFLEHLNVTTLLGCSIINSSVWGFRPRLSRLSLTQNLPKPLIKTSSPDASLDLMRSRRVSISSTDWLIWYPFSLARALTMSSLVRDIGEISLLFK